MFQTDVKQILTARFCTFRCF